MNVKFKITGGTVRGDGNLCESCHWALVIKGHANHQQLNVCDLIVGNPMMVPFPVATCSGYFKKGTLSKTEMEEIALIVKIPGRPAGFKTSDDK